MRVQAGIQKSPAVRFFDAGDYWVLAFAGTTPNEVRRSASGRTHA